jgi:hypothetical protein
MLAESLNYRRLPNVSAVLFAAGGSSEAREIFADTPHIGMATGPRAQSHHQSCLSDWIDSLWIGCIWDTLEFARCALPPAP